MLISLAPALVMELRAAMQLIADGVHGAPEIGRPPARGSRPRCGISARPPSLIERMTRREVPALIDHRHLKRFGEFDEVLHALFGVHARRPAMSTGFSAATRSLAASLTEPESPCGGPSRVSFGMRSVASFGDGRFLQGRCRAR